MFPRLGQTFKIEKTMILGYNDKKSSWEEIKIAGNSV